MIWSAGHWNLVNDVLVGRSGSVVDWPFCHDVLIYPEHVWVVWVNEFFHRYLFTKFPLFRNWGLSMWYSCLFFRRWSGLHEFVFVVWWLYWSSRWGTVSVSELYHMLV